MTNRVKPKRLSRTTIYESDWLNLHSDQVLLPAGRVLDQYHIVEMKKDSVAAIVKNHEKKILLIKTPRYPTDSIDWEIPAGFLENENDIFTGTSREILEETGYTTKNHELILKYHPVNGISDSLTYIVLCDISEKQSDFDCNETIETKWFSLDELKERILKNDIMGGTTLTALLYYLVLQG